MTPTCKDIIMCAGVPVGEKANQSIAEGGVGCFLFTLIGFSDWTNSPELAAGMETFPWADVFHGLPILLTFHAEMHEAFLDVSY